MRESHLVVAEFFEGADALRQAFDAVFENPYRDQFRRQVWQF